MKSIEKMNENWQHVVIGLLVLVIILQLNSFFDSRSISSQINRIDDQNIALKRQLDRIHETSLKVNFSSILNTKELKKNNEFLRKRLLFTKEKGIQGNH